MNLLEIKNLSIKTKNKILLKNINLTLEKGKTYSLQGKNGTGKSSLFKSIFSHPFFLKEKGDIFFNKKNITKLNPEEINKLGIFFIFQEPREIEGLDYQNFLYQLHKKQMQNYHLKSLSELRKDKNLRKEISLKESKNKFFALAKDLDFRIEKENLNLDFSGGEKKKSEILQTLLSKPKLILIDELDSGLDQESIKKISNILNNYQKETSCTLFIISHNPSFLENFKISKKFFIKNKTIV
jgi:Fe-S cluster assembly ATP-binding protein